MSRYINYDDLDYRNDMMHGKSSEFLDGVIYMAQRIEEAPSIDIVRCKDCKHFRFNECEMWGEPAEGNNPTSEDGNDYCSWGERKTDHE